ncbi:MAG: transporter substrate-binding domain-containing protein [Sulfitobacter sp.]
MYAPLVAFVLRKALLLAMFSIASLVPEISVAQSTERETLRMPYAEFYPYSYTAEDGQPAGYAIDIITSLAQHEGYDLAFVQSPNPRIFYELLDAGEVDLTPLLGLTPERIARSLPTTSFGNFEVSVFVRSDRTTDQIQDLSGLRIGVVSGSISSKATDRIAFPQVVEFDRTGNMIMPLLRGDVDAVISVADIFNEALRKSFIDDKVRRLEETLLVIPYGFLVRSDRPDIRAALNKAIGDVLQPDDLVALQDHWFGKQARLIDHPWFNTVAVGAVLAALSLSFLSLSNVRLYRRSHDLLAENGANGLLIDALDAVRASVTIFDRDMHLVHSNDSREARVPNLIKALQITARDAQDIKTTDPAGTMQKPKDRIETKAQADRIATHLQKGHTVQQIVHTRSGEVFDMQLLPLGTGHFASIRVDVTKLNEQSDRISAQARELEQKNERLLAFSAVAAHDLRSPLLRQESLLGFISEDLADAELEVPSDVRANLVLIRDMTRRMSVLVADLLLYAKADVTNEPLEDITPSTRLMDVVALIAPKPDFVVQIADDIPPIRANPAAFDMVMRNLISNAIKHHDRKSGVVKVRGVEEAGQVVIEVEDDGPGIPEDKRAAIFDPFCRLGNSDSTGLGLSFVRTSVEAWGGQIVVEPATPRGSIFRFSVSRTATPPLPVAQHLPAASPSSTFGIAGGDAISGR